MMRLLLVISTILFACPVRSQEKPETVFTWNAYAEAYYQYDFNKPADNTRPGFLYNHNRHNEFNINLAYLKGSFNGERTRGNLAIAAGTYTNANYAAEPGVLKNLFEANAGFKLSRKKNLWLDVGIFSSHIGFESAISKDCWTLTRSLLAENSPYYEAGAKLSYTGEGNKLTISLLALNGWQRIRRVDGNSLISGGVQFQYRPDDKILLNYSNFIGTDKPDSARLIRFFHNLYGIFSLNRHWGLTLGFDIGMEEKTTGSGNHTWYAPVAILRYRFNNRWAAAARAEYYDDKKEVIISTGTPNGCQTSGYSLTLDYKASEQVLLRIEARNLHSKDALFEKENKPVYNSFTIAGSLAFSF